MRKQDIVAHVMSTAVVNKSQAEHAVNATFEAITNALADGEEVSIPGFGKFLRIERAARTGRNPQTGETIQIKASSNAAFRAAKALKDSLN
ncbi:MAG: HU family DNA-binding protein [Aestuariivita sp.]|nr:HU family DNA-binding protein [Aestuariivita sp.]MCY4203672.1 HU family DNA-binding protein [Aestuariivita sp.]MCY4287004.1 HU family DNA-binding protein [Aestuariivita sp.]MCY4347651.1 HU family DNA-binding protein [Aestuariivita sp.]